MVLLTLISIVIFLLTLPFVLLSHALPEFPALTAGMDYVFNALNNVFGVLGWFLTMGGNSIFVNLFKFNISCVLILLSMQVIKKVIDFVIGIFSKTQ